MYAIFENGSHQYKVAEGDQLIIDRRPEDEGAEIEFDRVLLVAGTDGASIGAPVVEGARVRATVIAHFRGKKIIIQKFRRRKNYRRRRGHRQSYTSVQITGLVVPA